MPTAYIKKLADEGKGSVQELESKWEDAKSQASKQGKAENFGYITSIFKSMVNASCSVDDLLLICKDALTSALEGRHFSLDVKSKSIVVKFFQPPNDKEILEKLVTSLKAKELNLSEAEYKPAGAGYYVVIRGTLSQRNAKVVYFSLNGRASIIIECY